MNNLSTPFQGISNPLSRRPWFNLQNAVLSLNMSRRNAARLERLVGVQTGKLSPVKAAEYLNMVSSRLKKANELHARQSLSKGFVQTIVNHFIPIYEDRGRLDISTVEGSPNIEGLEDLKFHVNRLGGAMGVDPSLLGFGDMLSGGLGEGGYFRLSILAAMKSEAIRHAIRTGLEELFCVHVALKHHKFFLSGAVTWNRQKRLEAVQPSIANSIYYRKAGGTPGIIENM